MSIDYTIEKSAILLPGGSLDDKVIVLGIIRAYSYRFKIEVSFKVLKHLIGVFFYRFWTSAWPRIGKLSPPAKNGPTFRRLSDPPNR